MGFIMHTSVSDPLHAIAVTGVSRRLLMLA